MSLLSLSEVKDYLEVAYTAQDTIIQIILDGAEQFVEEYCGIALGAAVRSDVVKGGGRSLWPISRPVDESATITITRINDANDEETVDADEFRTENDQFIRDDQSRWQGGRSRFRLAYTGGYTLAKIPAGLKMIIYDFVYRQYHNRGGKAASSAAGLSVSWQKIMDSDMIRRLNHYKTFGSVG